VQRGLTTAFYREVIQNVPRLGLYQPLMDVGREAMSVPPHLSDPFYLRFLDGCTCGLVAGCVSNPAEIVKARVQSGRYR